MQQKHYQAAQAGLGILSFVAAMTLKELSEFQFWALITAGAALVAYAIFGFLFSREGEIKSIWLPMMRLHPDRENLFPYRRAIPIKEAVQRAYDCTHDSGLAGTAEGWAKNGPGMEELGTYAQYFMNLGGYTLYGKKPSSGVYRAIPISEIGSLRFSADLSKLKHHGHQERPEYVDMVKPERISKD